MAGNEKKADISMTGNKSGKPSIDGKTLKRLMSVSYTHLDVYKRQT